MAMKPTDRILGVARGSVIQAIAWLASHGGHTQAVWDYLTEIYRLAPLVGMDPAILVAQSAHETANWTSFWWRERLNPAGIGITGDPAQNAASGTWDSGTDAARAQIVHMCVYAHHFTPEVAHPYRDLDPRYDAVARAGFAGTVRTIADLTGKWAVDRDYHTKLVAKGNAIFPGIPNQEGGTMALPIPRFEKRIAPRGIPNRTNLAMASPSRVTIHEVGNKSPGADAEMHVRFVHNGGGAANVSFHFIVGYDKVCQIIELDEACWHASDGYNGPGNRDSIAIETVQIGDFDRTLWHLAWLCAELVVNPGRFVWHRGVPKPYDINENRFQQHFNTSGGKNCPQTIRERGLWPTLMGRIDQYIALARNDAPPPSPPPPPPPQEPKEHTLPKGMSEGMARRLYERYDAPWGESFEFDLGRAASQVWVSRGKRSIPKGGEWSDEGTNWPALTEVIRRGDGGMVYRWADGSVYATRG